MLCPYTKELSEMYADGVEAVFYMSKDDFVSKVKYYLENDDEREKIARAGRERLLKSHNEARDRVRTIMKHYREIAEC